MTTDDEIRRRVESTDTSRTARRYAIALRVHELGDQHAALATQLRDISRQLRDAIGANQDIITIEELATFTGIAKTELRAWLDGYKAPASRRPRQPPVLAARRSERVNGQALPTPAVDTP